MNEKLESVAITAGRLAEARPLPPAPREIQLPGDDDTDPADEARIGYAEGQSFMIEYTDSRGQPSRRRVTVFDIKVGANGVAMLHARCHERNATRAFRVDRIQCCIDYDGEVHDDVPAFLEETFGMAADAFEAVERARVIETPREKRVGRPKGSTGKSGTHHSWNELRALVRPQAVVFAALSRSDGTMRPEEIGIAVEHLATHATQRGEEVSEKDREAMAAYIKRQRPDTPVILTALEEISASAPHEVTDFLMAALALIDVDGNRDAEEIALVNELSQALAGMDMA